MPDRPVEEWVAEVEAREDPRRAEARGRAMSGLTDRVSDAWPVLAEHEIPTLLFLATEPPHVHENRAHIARFEAAVPHAEVRWVEGAGHGMLADVGAAARRRDRHLARRARPLADQLAGPTVPRRDESDDATAGARDIARLKPTR